MKTVPIQFRDTPAWAERIRCTAAEKGLSVSDLARFAVHDFCNTFACKPHADSMQTATPLEVSPQTPLPNPPSQPSASPLPTSGLAYDGEILKITRKLDKALRAARPELDMPQMYLEADAWEVANPEKRKKRHGQFMFNWLRIEMEKRANGKVHIPIQGNLIPLPPVAQLANAAAKAREERETLAWMDEHSTLHRNSGGGRG